MINNNRMRGELEAAVAALSLFSPDREARAKSINDLKDAIDEGKLGLLDKAIGAETDAESERPARIRGAARSDR